MYMQTIEHRPAETEEVPRITTQRVIDLIEEDPLPPFSVPIRKKAVFSVRRVVWTLVVLLVLVIGAMALAIVPMIGC
jgi:hypothetical protein